MICKGTSYSIKWSLAPLMVMCLIKPFVNLIRQLQFLGMLITVSWHEAYREISHHSLQWNVKLYYWHNGFVVLKNLTCKHKLFPWKTINTVWYIIKTKHHITKHLSKNKNCTINFRCCSPVCDSSLLFGFSIKAQSSNWKENNPMGSWKNQTKKNNWNSIARPIKVHIHK